MAVWIAATGLLPLLLASSVNANNLMFSRLYRQADGLAHPVVRDIAETPDGCVWFATWGGGISRFDGLEWQSYTKESGLPGNMIRIVQSGGGGGIWAGTPNGIACIHNGHCVTYTSENTPILIDDSVFSILHLQNDEIWFGTQTGRLFACHPLDGNGTPAALAGNSHTSENGWRTDSQPSANIGWMHMGGHASGLDSTL